jgi:cytochrome bd-type quinol oxidase subunit 2
MSSDVLALLLSRTQFAFTVSFHALLGATWLVLKGDGVIRERSYRAIQWLLTGVLLFLAFAFVAGLYMHLRVLHRSSSATRPCTRSPSGRR